MSKLNLKIPETLPFLPKKRIFKKLPNTILVAGIATVAAGGVWYGHSKGLIKNSLLDKLLGPAGAAVPPAGTPVVTQPASSITLSAYPPVVRPNSNITITGQFMGPMGPVTVAGGYYAVFEDLQNGLGGPRRIVAQGMIGQNLTMYSATIPTTNFLDGTYTIVVSDQPVTSDPGLPPAGSGPVPGAQGYSPGSSQTVTTPFSTGSDFAPLPFDQGGSNYGITIS